jgi:hypothetical protein
MKAGMHQPNFIPWMGYFYKIYKSDVFILGDDVQYSKENYINRNRIKTPQGDLWLSVPVKSGGNRYKINEVIISNETDWRARQLKTIEAFYKKAPYFSDYYDEFRSVLMQDWIKLSDLNISLIRNICKVLDIKTDIVISSHLKVEGSSTERIINTCKAVGADGYLSGSGGAKYQDEAMFTQNSIKLTYVNFKQKPYKQLWGEYAGNLSILDYIFNCGFDIKNFWSENEASGV